MCCPKRKKQSCFGYSSLRELMLQRSVREVAVKNLEVINMYKKLLVCLLISALLLLDQVKSSNAVPWGRRDFAEWNLLKVMTFFRAKLDNLKKLHFFFVNTPFLKFSPPLSKFPNILSFRIFIQWLLWGLSSIRPLGCTWSVCWRKSGCVHFLYQGHPTPECFQMQCARKISDGFLYALEACLVNLELPPKLFICSDVLGDLWSSRKF